MRAPLQVIDQVVAQTDDGGAGALVGGGKRGVLQLGADEQVLGGVLVKARQAR